MADDGRSEGHLESERPKEIPKLMARLPYRVPPTTTPDARTSTDHNDTDLAPLSAADKPESQAEDSPRLWTADQEHDRRLKNLCQQEARFYQCFDRPPYEAAQHGRETADPGYARRLENVIQRQDHRVRDRQPAESAQQQYRDQAAYDQRPDMAAQHARKTQKTASSDRSRRMEEYVRLKNQYLARRLAGITQVVDRMRQQHAYRLEFMTQRAPQEHVRQSEEPDQQQERARVYHHQRLQHAMQNGLEALERTVALYVADKYKLPGEMAEMRY